MEALTAVMCHFVFVDPIKSCNCCFKVDYGSNQQLSNEKPAVCERRCFRTEVTLHRLSILVISPRSLFALDSCRSDMTDQDKWLGSKVRSIQSSNCLQQQQKAMLSTSLHSLRCSFHVFLSKHGKLGMSLCLKLITLYFISLCCKK